MYNTEKTNKFEISIKEYLKQGQQKLENDLIGTREAIRLIAEEKMKQFITSMDRGLDKEEREYLVNLFVSAMFQSFCFGYSIGKVEGKDNRRVML